MPLGPQPRKARGTVEHPYTALTLRLVLAVFGLVFCAALAAVLLWRGHLAAGIVAAALAVIALIDLAVIQQRRSSRRGAAERGRSS